MKTRTRKALNLSGEHAAHALRILIAEGKTLARDVEKAVTRREALIRELRDKLAALGDGSMTFIAGVRRTVVRNINRRAKPRISAATRARYRQQGRYLAALRPLSKQGRVRVKAIRKKSGVIAAIKAADVVARKKSARATRGKASRKRIAKKIAKKAVTARRRKAPAPARTAGASPAAA